MKNRHSIKPIGTYFEMTNEGYILNPTSMELIPSKWRPLIDLVKTTILKEFQTDLHSIYLRGSVARGSVTDRYSDLDLFVLLKQSNIRWKVADWLEGYHENWKNEFPFVKAIEVMCSSFSENIYASNPALAMIIKTQSILLYGPAISESIPAFKPSKEMMLNYRWLEKDLQAFFAKANPQADEVQEITKVIIRSGFEVVMERVGKYTTDLYLCYQAFSEYYPNWSSKMNIMLYYYLNPEEDLGVLTPNLKALGDWLVLEIKQKI